MISIWDFLLKSGNFLKGVCISKEINDRFYNAEDSREIVKK